MIGSVEALIQLAHDNNSTIGKAMIKYEAQLKQISSVHTSFTASYAKGACSLIRWMQYSLDVEIISMISGLTFVVRLSLS